MRHRSAILLAAFVLSVAGGARAQVEPAGSSPVKINVKDHNARGDGTTDETAAFDATMAAIAGRAARVVTPLGTYRFRDRRPHRADQGAGRHQRRVRR